MGGFEGGADLVLIAGRHGEFGVGPVVAQPQRAADLAGFSALVGHGDSGKPHDAVAYGHDRMADDAVAVMDAAGLGAPFVCGYSMGGFIGLRLLAAHPGRVARLAVCGVGETYLQDRITAPQARAVLAEALLTPDPSTIADARGRMFRAFADQMGKDRFTR